MRTRRRGGGGEGGGSNIINGFLKCKKGDA